MWRRALFLAFSILCAIETCPAQPDHYSEIAIKRSPTTQSSRCEPRSGSYDRPPTFLDAYEAECEGIIKQLKVDYAASRLLYWSTGGDCHMRVDIKAFRSDADRRVRLVVNNIYGGCRAGGSRAGWVVIDKPPAGYKVSVEEVRLDRRFRGESDEQPFIFPWPPSLITVEEVATRPVELIDCLPLTGQSQWILSSDEHLARALDGRANAVECRQRINDLDIDLKTSALIGVSFSTGGCEKPALLTFTMTKETSTRAGRDRYVLRAVYDDPAVSCTVWTTHGSWIAAPKFDAGYGFEVDARPRSKAGDPRPDDEESNIEWKESA